MLRSKLTVVAMAVVAALAATTLSVSAQTVEELEREKRARAEQEEAARQAEEEARRRDVEARAKKAAAAQPTDYPAFKVYEWGVETLTWNGSAEKEVPGDIPSFYYRADQIPLEADPSRLVKPEVQPKPRGGPGDPEPGMDKKPVLYFECDQNVLFDLEVVFSAGEPTWLYPKANRRPDKRSLQWDNIQLFGDRASRRLDMELPELREIKSDHWANFSRSGSVSSLFVNDEHERFIFYEGTNGSLPEVDIFKNPDGDFVVRNYTRFPIYNVRWTYKADGGERRLCVGSVPAAMGDEKPGQVVLKPARNGVTELHSEMRADLSIESAGAGLTAEQGEVFARCWHGEITGAGAGTLSYRRDPKRLDELMRLTVTLPRDAKLTPKYQRVGYVVISGVDLSRQAELDGWASAAASGDKDATAKLKKEGMSAVGAVRRVIADEGTALKQRVALAKLLAEMARK